MRRHQGQSVTRRHEIRSTATAMAIVSRRTVACKPFDKPRRRRIFRRRSAAGRRQVQSTSGTVAALVTPSHLRSAYLLAVVESRPAVGHQTDACAISALSQIRRRAHATQLRPLVLRPSPTWMPGIPHASSRSRLQSVADATFHRRRARDVVYLRSARHSMASSRSSMCMFRTATTRSSADYRAANCADLARARKSELEQSMLTPSR
jgi:hypothetical protein